MNVNPRATRGAPAIFEEHRSITPIVRCGSRDPSLRSGFWKSNATIARVLKVFIAATLFLGASAVAQQPQPSGQPQVKVNILNVCTPSAEEQAVIKAALERVPGKPAFVADFEVARGLATVKDALPSKFVRLRREFPAESPLLTAQYSMSTDAESTTELLVLRGRDAKEFHEIALEDQLSTAAASPTAIVAADTPVNRIKVERFGKSSVGLSRCQGVDQSAYEPFFRQASDIVARYRAALGLRTAFRSDIAWLTAEKDPKTPRGKSSQPNNPK